MTVKRKNNAAVNQPNASNDTPAPNQPKRRKSSVAAARIGPNLRDLVYSPDKNPLMENQTVQVKRRWVTTQRQRDLVDPDTGAVEAMAAIHQLQYKDDEGFVKVFADGVKAAFALSKTAARVFSLVLTEYQRTPMSAGYAEAVYLAWFDGGLSGQDVGMTDRTFHTGLRELLNKHFLSPKAPNLYWVNPTLFFRGNRVAFVTEYRRRRPDPTDSLALDTPSAD